MTTAETVTLIEKRDRMQRQLAAGRYRSLIDVILDGTGRIIQKLFRGAEPPAFWVSAAVIVLTALLVRLVILLLARESFAVTGLAEEAIMIGLPFFILIVIRLIINLTYPSLREHILPAIQSTAGLTDVQRWLETARNVRGQLLFSLFYAACATPLILLLYPRLIPGLNMIFWSVFILFLTGMGVYYLFLFLGLPLRLGRIQFKLYPDDPGSSELVAHLSGMLNRFVYLYAVAAGLATLALAVLRVLDLRMIVSTTLVGWIPLATCFVTSHYALSKIITGAKWKTLNEIQAKIQVLKTKDLTDKETIETVLRLMDYHDRVKATRESALGIGAGLNLFNSMLLPVLGLLLGNIEQLLKLAGLTK